VRAILCTVHDAAITGVRASLRVHCDSAISRTARGRETMMRTSRETAECLLVHAHALRLHAHRSLAVSARERGPLDACIGRFEASLLLDAAGTVVAAFGLMVAARALPVYGLLTLADPRSRRIPWRWRHLVFWAGLRGALSVALALSLTGNRGVDPQVATIAYGVVVLSLLVQGGLTGLISRRLLIGAGEWAGAGRSPR